MTAHRPDTPALVQPSNAPDARRGARPARASRLRLVAVAAALLAVAPAATQVLAQDAAEAQPVPTAVVQELGTADLLTHLGLLGWGIEYHATEAFGSFTVAVVAFERPHIEAEFERQPVGGAFTAAVPEPLERIDLGLVLDGRGEVRRLTLRVGDDTSTADVELPAVLGGANFLVRRPYIPGTVIPTDPEGRFILAETYREGPEGTVSTGRIGDMLAYLALEVSTQ